MIKKYNDKIIDEFIESISAEIPCWRCPVEPTKSGICEQPDCAVAIRRKLQELSK